VAAAVLAVLYLGWYGFTRSQQLADLEEDVSRKNSEFKRRESYDRQAATRLEENAEKAALAQQLFALAGSGEQTARLLAGLREALPRDFWVSELSSDWGFDPELGVTPERPLPILHVEGRAREGTDAVTAVFGGFVQELKGLFPESARVKDRMFNRNEGFVLDLTLLVPPAEDEGADEEEDE
jgi:hypothetical protein